MGNEMGNNNTTGLKEENTDTQVQEKSLQDSVHIDEVEKEKPLVSKSEVEDAHGNETAVGLDHPSAAGDHFPENQKYEEGIELHDPSAQSLNLEETSNEECTKESEIQPSSSPNGLDMEEVSRTNDLEPKEQNPVNKEEVEMGNSTFDALNTSQDSGPLESADSKTDDNDLAENGIDPSMQDRSGLHQEREHVLISNLEGDCEKNKKQLDAELSNKLNESSVVDANPDVETGSDEAFDTESMSKEEVCCHVNVETEDVNVVGDDLSREPTIPSDLLSDVETICNGGLPTDLKLACIDSSGSQVETILLDKPLNYHEEVSVLNKEITLIENVSQDSLDPDTAQFCKELVKKSETIEENAAEPELIISRSGHQNMNNESCDSRTDKKFQVEEPKLLDDGHLFDTHIDNSNEAYEENTKKSRKEASMVAESEMLSTDSFLTNSKCEEEEAKEKKIVEEIEDQEKRQISELKQGNYSVEYEGRESFEKLSSESSPDSLSSHVQMRKSPSFNLDLRTEESEQTPLLYQDKSAIQSLLTLPNVSFQHPNEQAQNGQVPLQYEPMQVEEKIVTVERSDSDKSKAPFLGFLKEEARVVVKPPKQEKATKEVASNSQKGKEKRKPRPSLFGHCLCCATVIN